MNKKSARLFLLILLGFALFFSSCLSTPDSSGKDDGEKKAVGQKISSLSSLWGVWRFSGLIGGEPMSFLEYPFSAKKNDDESRTFFKFSSELRDDTGLWAAFAAEKGMSLSEVWQKRSTYLNDLYGAGSIPACDENGSERGVKVFYDEERICFQSFVLVPENIMMQNIDCFLVSADDMGVWLDDGAVFLFYSSFDKPSVEKKCSHGVGLVLSGGGGKGAYEVGVWKALIDFGVASRVTAFSGSSVGGLNAALFATSDFDYIDDLWRNVVPSELVTEKELISQEGLKKIIDSMSFSSLQEKKSPAVFVTAVRNNNLALKFIGNVISSLPGRYATRFLLNEEADAEQIRKKLLATSAFPVFTQPILLSDGYKYIDGGAEEFGGDNTPIDPIVDNFDEITDIIVVYLSSTPERRIKKINYDTKFIAEVIPTIDLGDLFEGTMNFDSDRIRLLIDQGYRDMSKILRDELGLFPVSRFWIDGSGSR
ncbi:MAG: patatin-like phospholipase family protein [Treponema sp.]|nr:patatin-like phospholipase family protein [Treponema sp.]